jgi:hypothetical protein
MNHFPFFSQLDAGIINAIQNLDKTKFSGAMPYVYFAHYLGLGQTIGQTINWDYKSGGERFPPIITNLEVKPNGSMGVVRHGIVTVKFASMNQLKQYQNFFRIGNAKSIVWGWNKNRTTCDNQQPSTITINKAKDLAGNIKAWLDFCAGTSHTSDTMVGPLIDFSFTLNPDASVDATFTVGTKTEIPAYLGMNNHGTKQTPASSQNNKIDTKLARLLEPDNVKFKEALKNDIKNHLLNYEFVKSKQGANQVPSTAAEFFKKYFTTGYIPTERVYVDMATLIKYTVNKQKTKGAIVDISQSIAKAHPNMISTSENIIFPNSKMANPIRTGGVDDASLTLDITNTQNFKVHDREFVNHTQNNLGKLKFNGYTNEFLAGTYGNVEEIYVDVDFALDAWYNTGEGSVKDFIDKLCTEINIASAGLMELGLDESADSKTDNSVLTIIDYNLVPNGTPEVPQIDLFGNDTSIINMSFNSDLPKEIISMAMLGNRKGIEIGRNLFFEYQKDFLSDILPTGAGAPYLLAKPADVLDVNGNYGLDNIIKKGTAELNKKGQKTTPTTTPTAGFKIVNPFQVSQDGLKKGMEMASLNAATQGLIDENCIVIANGFDKEHTDSSVDAGTKVVLKDVALVKNLYFTDPKLNKNNPLLPAELELTVLGISGITVGRIVRIKDLPFQNTNDGLMQVIEVNHRVSDSTWETTIKLKYRPVN